MSLKAFHIFFIVLSAILCLGIGAQRVSTYASGGGVDVLAQAIVALLAGISLLVYGRGFLKKTKGLSYLTFVFFLLGPVSADACSVCFGGADSQQGAAMKAGIFVLLGFIGTVLAGFGGLFLYWMSRSRRLAPTQES